VGVYRIGNQRVGVERETVTGYGDYGDPITESVTVWVDNACFEVQTPTEQQNLTVTTSEVAWAMLPIADSAIPAVNDQGQDAALPFLTSGKPTINANSWLWHNGLRYAMRGDSVLEQDIRGRQDHVFCICEREQG